LTADSPRKPGGLLAGIQKALNEGFDRFEREGNPAVKVSFAPGKVTVLKNNARREGEPDRWLRVYLLLEEGMTKVKALFTSDELLTAVGRVPENREDLTGPKQDPGVVARVRKAINDAFNRIRA
jgi:hypothetical protein